MVYALLSSPKHNLPSKFKVCNNQKCTKHLHVDATIIRSTRKCDFSRFLLSTYDTVELIFSWLHNVNVGNLIFLCCGTRKISFLPNYCVRKYD